MAEYVRIEVERVEAEQFYPNASPWPEGVIPWSNDEFRPRDMSFGYIGTEEGPRHVCAGDWIVTDKSGGKWHYTAEVFKEKYTRVPDADWDDVPKEYWEAMEAVE